MADGRLGPVARYATRAVLLDGGGLTDGQLLARFLARREEASFEALVRRHGAMVLGVCRRVLRHPQDAEDACQAAFLVLARRAASIRQRDSVGSWLHGVAFRAAANLRRQFARRRVHEEAAARPPAADATEVTW